MDKPWRGTSCFLGREERKLLELIREVPDAWKMREHWKESLHGAFHVVASVESFKELVLGLLDKGCIQERGFLEYCVTEKGERALEWPRTVPDRHFLCVVCDQARSYDEASTCARCDAAVDEAENQGH